MRASGRVFIAAVPALLCAIATQVPAQVRTIALAGDAAPGVPAATFISFPSSAGLPVCDATGHAAFPGLTSGGVLGMWTDDLGSLSPIALSAGTVPWYPGTATLTELHQAILSDNQRVVFSGKANTPASLTGVWIQDGAGAAIAAGTGIPAPAFNGPSTFLLTPPPSGNMTYRFSRNGRLALMGADAIGTPSMWNIDPPPGLGRQFCVASHGAVLNPGYWSFQSNFVFNDLQNDALQLLYLNGTTRWWVAQGPCGLLGPVLADGDLVPTAGGTIPSAANVNGMSSLVPPDLNNSNAIVFPALLYNAGVTAANDEVYYLRDGTGFHVVAREGDPSPALSPGESLWPYFTIAGGTPPKLLVSDGGSVAFEAMITPSNTPAVLLRKPDGSLHVLARSGDPAPGYPGWNLVFSIGTPIEMNHFGQVLVQSAVCSAAFGCISSTTALFATDDNAHLQPVFLSGDTYQVRPGLTGTLALNGAAPVTAPFTSGGSDGQPRNFSDFGEYFFRGQFTPSGGGASVEGVFAVKGPGLTLSAGSESPRNTRLESVSPNPAPGRAHVAFELSQAGHARLEILDLAGRRVKTLRDGWLAANRYDESWQGDDDTGHAVAGGVYFVRLVAAGESSCQRIVILQ